jgi:hypothetical protein
MKVIQEAIRKLQQYGFHECTEAASKQDSTEYLCAFERAGEEQGTYYCCVTEDDLFALVSLVEASASPV